MDTLQALQEKRRELAAKIRELAAKFEANGKKWADGDQANWEACNRDYDAVATQMEDARAAADVAARAARVEDEGRQSGRSNPALPEGRSQREPAAGPADDLTRSRALAAFCRGQLGRFLDDEDVAAMRACRMNPNQRELVIQLPDSRGLRSLQSAFTTGHASRARQRAAECRDLSAVTYGSGGALVPETFIRQLEINMLAFGGMRQVAETIVTGSGERMVWPTADDTSNTGQQLGESTSIGSSVDPTFGGVAWDAYKFSSKAVLVPYELLEDSFVDLPGVLGAMLGERLGRITNTKFTTGSGANTPKGIVTAASLGYTAASATAIVYDEVIRLEHSVDPAYRMGAGYMCHDNVVLALRLLKDSNGMYLWQNGIDSGSTDRLNGYPLTVNQDMASSVATTNKTLLFGQLSRYKIRRVNQVRLYRLEERYRDTDQDGFIALLREDGNLLDAGTDPVKYLQQA